MLKYLTSIHQLSILPQGGIVKPSDAMDFFNMEIWKDIEGYEGLYQVSNLGNVKRLPKKNTIANKLRAERILVPHIVNKYYYVVLSNRKPKTFKLSRIVAKAFIPNPENKPQVNHKNGIKTDDRVENLEWNTASENQRHSIDVLGKKFSSKPVSQFNLDGIFVKSFDSQNEAANYFGGTPSNISQCISGKSKSAFGFKWKFKN